MFILIVFLNLNLIEFILLDKIFGDAEEELSKIFIVIEIKLSDDLLGLLRSILQTLKDFLLCPAVDSFFNSKHVH